MEDEKIRDFFRGFDPKLSADADFMDRLMRTMDSVEFIRQRTAVMKRRSRRAAAMAAAVGFGAGVVLTAAFPRICAAVGRVVAWFPDVYVAVDTNIISWILIAGATMLSSVAAYRCAAASD